MKILIVILLAALNSQAEHWNLYCQGNEMYKLIQFNPVYEVEGGEKYLTESYPQFNSIEPNNTKEVVTNKGGTYYNLCMGWWDSSGTPSNECATYCKSALNLMHAIRTDIERVDAAAAAPFKTLCAIPKGNCDGTIYSKELNPECCACNSREYNKSVQRQMENCLVAFKAYTAKTLGTSATRGGNR